MITEAKLFCFPDYVQEGKDLHTKNISLKKLRFKFQISMFLGFSAFLDNVYTTTQTQDIVQKNS